MVTVVLAQANVNLSDLVLNLHTDLLDGLEKGVACPEWREQNQPQGRHLQLPYRAIRPSVLQLTGWIMIERVQFRDVTMVHRCFHGMSPEYLSELCFPVKQRPSRYQLRSPQSNQQIVPPVKFYGPRSFAVAGPINLTRETIYLNILSILTFQ